MQGKPGGIRDAYSYGAPQEYVTTYSTRRPTARHPSSVVCVCVCLVCVELRFSGQPDGSCPPTPTASHPSSLCVAVAGQPILVVCCQLRGGQLS